MDVDSARAEEGGIHVFLAVHREDHDPLVLKIRYPVHEIEQRRRRHARVRILRDVAVQILDDDDGFRRALHQQNIEVGVVDHLPQIDVVDVVIEEIRDGGDEAGFPRAGGAVEEITPLPNAP